MAHSFYTERKIVSFLLSSLFFSSFLFLSSFSPLFLSPLSSFLFLSSFSLLFLSQFLPSFFLCSFPLSFFLFLPRSWTWLYDVALRVRPSSAVSQKGVKNTSSYFSSSSFSFSSSFSSSSFSSTYSSEAETECIFCTWKNIISTAAEESWMKKRLERKMETSFFIFASAKSFVPIEARERWERERKKERKRRERERKREREREGDKSQIVIEATLSLFLSRDFWWNNEPSCQASKREKTFLFFFLSKRVKNYFWWRRREREEDERRKSFLCMEIDLTEYWLSLFSFPFSLFLSSLSLSFSLSSLLSFSLLSSLSFSYMYMVVRKSMWN